jgi:hypothetical protein
MALRDLPLLLGGGRGRARAPRAPRDPLQVRDLFARVREEARPLAPQRAHRSAGGGNARRRHVAVRDLWLRSGDDAGAP